MVNRTLEEHTKFYEGYTNKAIRYHSDTTRKDFQAQLWFELDRNKISLSMLGNLCKDKDVIDLGSAHWVEKALLKQIGAKSIVKVDIAPDDGEALKLDACDTQLPEKSFDVVICRELIEHVLDADKLMNEIRRLLKDNGYLLIATPNVFNLPPDGEAHIGGYTPRGFIQILERHNFTILDKRGNIPAIFQALIPMVVEGYQWILDEFVEISQKMEETPSSYYFGTNMFILGQKGCNVKDTSCPTLA